MAGFLFINYNPPIATVGSPYSADIAYSQSGLPVVTATLKSSSVSGAVLTNRLEGDVNYVNISFTAIAMSASGRVNITIRCNEPDDNGNYNEFSWAIFLYEAQITPPPPPPPPPPISVFDVVLTMQTVVKNVAFSFSIGSTNQVSGVTWAITDQGTLPVGVTLSSAGMLTGTITTIGAYSFTVTTSHADFDDVVNQAQMVVTEASTTNPLLPPVTPPIPPEPPQVKITKESYSETEWLLTHTATDSTAWALLPTQDSTGTVNYNTGVLYFPPEMLFPYKKWSNSRDSGTGEWIDGQESDTWTSGSQISVTYQNESAVQTQVTETLPPNVISINLTPYTTDSIVPGSVKFTIGTTTYTDLEGVIYHTPDSIGYGTEAGTIDYASGYAVLDNWVSGSPTFTLLSLALMKGTYSDTAMHFRIPSAPIKPTAFTLAVTAADGELLSATADLNQDLIGTGIVGTIDAEFGLCSVRFGATVLDSSLTAEEKAEEWYDIGDVVGGNIWKPRNVIPSTARYNTVAFTTIPLSADVLGIDPVRLPSDGKVPSLLKGQLILIHQTTAFFENSLSPTQVIDCERTRLYRAVIAGANGVRLSPEHYTLNRELGTITMSPTLSLTGLTSPYTIEHTIADLCVIADNDLSGWLTLTRPISHAYPMATSFCSGLMYIGTMQARVTSLFAQSTWTSVWQDTLIGSEPLAQYNDAQYPIVITNAGAYPDRILVKFTSSTAFQVIGEQLGIIGSGDITQDCSPLNSLTGVAYFTIDYRGWGVGWATGNCLRFNVVSSSYPVDLIRSIQPSEPSGLDVDSVELLLLGNVDA